MNKKRLLLLKNFLKASSRRNFIKYTKDASKKKKSVGNSVAYVLIFLMIVIYGTLASIGLVYSGSANVIPVMTATLLTALAFILTLFRASGYLFSYKEYDMLVSMPFEIKDVVAAKFFYMYIKSLPLLIALSLSMYVGYLFGAKFSIVSMIFWLVLTLVIPIIPMVISSALGAVFAKIGSAFRHKTLVQTILIFIIVLPTFFIRFIVEDIFREDKASETLDGVADTFSNIGKILFTAKWFSKAIIDKNIICFILLIVLTVIVFELFFIILSKYYRKINSRLGFSAAHKDYELKKNKKRSMVVAIAFKEYKRMTGSTTYLVNVSMGVMLTFILGLVAIFVDADVLIKTIMNGAPVTADIIAPVVPVFVYFLVGMVATTACSPSLEGKNYWIMQTLPIDVMTDCKGKILFNLLLMYPVAAFATLTLSICFNSGIGLTLISMVTVFVMCLFSSVYGLKCGLKHRKLEWTNEVEVVKQGMAVTLYLLPNMFLSMLLLPAVVFASLVMPAILVNVILIALYGLLTVLSYAGVKKFLHNK